MYNTLKFLHVVSAIVWVGGFILMLVLNRRFARAGDPALVRALGQQGAALSGRLFGPSAVVALITGIGMVQVGNLSFGSLWISWGFTGLFLSVIIGGVLTGGTARKLARQMAAGPVEPAHIAAIQRRMMMFAYINAALLLSVVWAMVFKPM